MLRVRGYKTQHRIHDKVRITHIRWGESTGGVERFLKDLAFNYDRELFEMRFIFLSCGGPYEEEMRSGGHHVAVIPAENGYEIGLRFRLIQELRKNIPDLIHVHGGPPLLIPFVKLFLRIPVLYFDHGHIEINQRKGKAWLNFLNGLEMKLISNGVVVNSEVNGALVMHTHHLHKNCIKVIHLGIDLDYFKPSERSISSQHMLLGYVGRIQNYDKGVDYLPLLAVRLLNIGLHDFSIRVIGDGPDMLQLRNVTSTLGVSSHFEFLGRCNDIPELLKGIDVLVVTSRTEAFGLVAVEALAMGCKVVAFAVGGLPEVLSGCSMARIVPPDDIGAMAQALIELWNSREIDCSKDGIIFVKQYYDIKRMTRELQQHYFDVLLRTQQEKKNAVY